MRIVIGEDSVLFPEGLAALLADSAHDTPAMLMTHQVSYEQSTLTTPTS